MWHISERAIFNWRTWKMRGAAAELMSDWGWGVQLEILAGLMEYAMKDWIRTGTWNKTAWDYLLEDLELTCDDQLPLERKLSVWPPLLGGWHGSKALGPCGGELVWRALQGWEADPAEATACWVETEAFWSASVVCMGDDSPSCTGLFARWKLSLQQKMNELATWKQKEHLLILNWKLIHDPMCYQRWHL